VELAHIRRWLETIEGTLSVNAGFLVGHSGETYGDTLIVDFWGRVLERLPRGTGVVTADFDPKRQADARARFPALSHRVM